jgi:ABC-type nitrate/sulfonate/bicarbonate transport system substrate-binding protein
MSSIRLLRTAIVGLICFAVFPPIHAQQGPTEHIHILTLAGIPLPVIAGQMRGTFAKYGIEVEMENLASSDLMRGALAAGKGDVAYAAVDNAVAMVEMTGADVQIVSGGEGSQNELIVQPTIKSVKDLQGHVILVDAVHTAYALQLKKILHRNGMETPKDYELNAFGATPVRLKALMENKEFAGSMLPPPSSIEALHAGLASLGSVPNLLGAYQAGGHFVERKWAQGHRAVLVKYIAAFVESQRWVMDPAHKQQVIGMMIEKQHLTPDVAAEYYGISMTRSGGFEVDGRLDPAGFENVLKLRAEVEGQWGGHPPAMDKYYNDAYYREALTKIK